MANRGGRVPLTAEMNTFNTKVGGNQQLRAGGKAQYGAVVSNTMNQTNATTQRLACSFLGELCFCRFRQTPDLVDQGSFAKQLVNSCIYLNIKDLCGN